MVAVVVGSLSYVTYSLDMLGNFSESLIVEESRQSNKQMESFEITSVDVTGLNKLNTIIKNTGQIPLQITNLYIDEQDVDDVVQKITIDKTISPGSSFDLLAEGIDVDIDPTKGYNLKMSTSRGTAESFFVNSGSAEPLYMNLHAFPSVVSTGFPSSLIFNVVNNMSNNNALYNLTPMLDADSETGLGTVDGWKGPYPPSYPVLNPGDVATFEYIYTVSGFEGQFVDFGVYLQNGYDLPSNPGYLQSLNTTVGIKDVEVALQSGSAITSFGIEDFENQDINALIFHDETFGVPSTITSYQMDGSSVSGFGTTFNSFDDGPIIFFTSNQTQEHIMTQPSNWNASLQYYSNLTAPSIPAPDFGFFFENEVVENGDKDHYTESTGNLYAIGDEKGSLKADHKDGKPVPTWTAPGLSNGGPHDDGFVTFDATGAYLKGDWKVENDDDYSDLGLYPDADALWIKIPASPDDDYMPVVTYGHYDDDGDDSLGMYEISIGDRGRTQDGRVVFSFATTKDTTEYTECVSDVTYGAGWIHVFALRSSAHECYLYVNGTEVGNHNPTGYSSNDIDPGKKISMGTETHKDNKLDKNFSVASWMHWNGIDNDLTSVPNNVIDPDQIEDLFYTNYGQNGTRIKVMINHTDAWGGLIETIISDDEFVLPFHEPSIKSPDVKDGWYSARDADTGQGYLKFSQANFTGLFTGHTDLDVDIDERISIGFETIDDGQNLPINIRVDANNFPGGPLLDNMNSFLQTGPVSPLWDGYLNIGVLEEIQLTIFNEGPEGVWLQYPGTRVVLHSNDVADYSFGAFPKSVNVIDGGSGDLNGVRDSVFIPNLKAAEITFYYIVDPPMAFPTHGDPSDPSAHTHITAGEYEVSIYISGYDDAGSSFLRTVDLGTAQVTAP